MNSNLTPLAVIKVLLLAALCSGSLSACYVQPHSSHVTVSGQPHPTQLHNVAVQSLPVGRYSQTLLPSKTELVIDVIKTGLTLPAKEIKFSLSAQSPNSAVNQPACHFQGMATLMGQDALHGMVYNASVSSLTSHIKVNNANVDLNKGLVFFRFKDNVLSVDSNNPDALNLLCQSQIDLKGDYAKLK